MLEDSLNFFWIFGEEENRVSSIAKIKEKNLNSLNNSYFRKNIFRVVDQEMR